MDKYLEQRLDCLKSFAKKHPNYALGGSAGLFLHGYDIKRDWSKSDLDIDLSNEYFFENKKEYPADSGMDFNYCLHIPFGPFIVKIDVKLYGYDKLVFEEKKCNGFVYKVQHALQILRYKAFYAKKGVEKHKKDLIHLGLNIDELLKPQVVTVNIDEFEDIDLPF